jgi:hypothetical protein
MLIILSIYSSILALAVWQQDQNDSSTSETRTNAVE